MDTSGHLCPFVQSYVPAIVLGPLPRASHKVLGTHTLLHGRRRSRRKNMGRKRMGRRGMGRRRMGRRGRIPII